jgi:putative OPT family oligopeptide transporter
MGEARIWMAPQNLNGTRTPSGNRGELTLPAVFLGLVLSVVMGAANVYLGLRAGMTVSASIPAAVISLGILRGLLGRKSVLESNLVQTAASAGESLAAGIIFTMPALLLTGIWQQFDFWTTTLIALSGGTLGVLFMIPMRKVFVVDNKELKFPEGVACAEVLRAGAMESPADDSGRGTGLSLIVSGIGMGAAFKFLQSFAGLVLGTAETAVARFGRVYYLGADISPALFAVGYIITLPIALQIFAGGALGWLICIPWLSAGVALDGSAVEIAHRIWSEQVRYLGVGAMIVGGIASIWTVRSGLRAAVVQMLDAIGPAKAEEMAEETERNLRGSFILALALSCIALVGGIYFQLLEGAVALTLLATAAMVLMSFFFSAVASYIVGLVGNSNSPVSGMTITALLATGGLLWLFGYSGSAGIIATLGVAGVVCCVACTSGDVCNDLKTGCLVGASPRRQQIMQIMGILVASFVMAPVMTVLHQGSIRAGTGGIGGTALPAPQAGLFAALAKGIFADDGKLPKAMVAWGVAVGVALLLADFLLRKLEAPVRLHVMPVAVGIYLPFGLSVPILLGGVIRAMVSRYDPPGTEHCAHRGTLVTSGLIAGESLIGVLLGVLAYRGVQSWASADWLLSRTGLSPVAQEIALQAISLLALLAVATWTFRLAKRT